MGVYIKGMEMPKSCLDCPFMVSRDNDDCILQSEEANGSFENWEQMKSGCPLVSVQPHGRMIDADALASDLTRFYEGEVTARKLIAEQPTIDAVPVVRCRDCKWHNELGSRDGKGYCQRPSYASGLHGYCHGKDTPPDWYCADAERKEGEGWHG